MIIIRFNLSKILIAVFFIFGIFNITAFSQKISEAEMVGVWKKVEGGGDFGEFIYHRTERLKYYLDDNPNGRIFARLCSKDKFPLAFIESYGFAYQFRNSSYIFKIPSEKIFFVRSSKCADRTEEYWFIPPNKSIQYDEIIPAENIDFTRLLGEYYEKSEYKKARNEFTENLKTFIEALKTDPQAQGFVIRNQKTKNKYFQKALQNLIKENISKDRFQLVMKNIYPSDFPEFMIVSMKSIK